MRPLALTASAFFCCLIFLLFPSNLFAATLSISPASGTFQVGDRVTVKVMVSSNSPINAISSIVSFPTGLFTIESVSKAGSILNFWVSEPNFSQGAGTLEFEGVTLGGYHGGTGIGITAILRAVKTGSGTVSFKSGQVLANDGQGTDVTDGMTGATFSVIPAKEKAAPPPQPAPVPEEVQPIPILHAPQIMLGDKYGELAISGTSEYHNAQALLTFVSESGVKILITGTTDDHGEFIILVPKTLKAGTYQAYAVVVRSDFSNSPRSNIITFPIGNFFSDAGWEVRMALLLLLILLIYLLIRIYLHLKRDREEKILLRKETREAETLMRRSLKLIREDAGNEKEVRKDIEEAESILSKEIKDIDNS